ncbi:MAG TPA: amino acid ABC transporter permease [Aestuariivirgaceae bacterium]|jgi:general L-amino acid transport system permease protein
MTAVADQTPAAKVSWFNDPKTRSLIVQAALLALLAWLGYEIVENTTDNLRALNQNFGWSFLNSTAGFDIIQRPLFYQNTSTFGRALLVGFVNTLIIAICGILAATLLGFLVGIMRLSKNLVISGVSTVFVECVRNVPLLLQILIWYAAVLKPLPSPREAIALGIPLPAGGFLIFVPLVAAGVYGFIQVFRRTPNGFYRVLAVVGLFVAFVIASRLTAVLFDDVFSVVPLGGYLSNRGLIIPWPIFEAEAIALPIALAVGIAAAFLIGRWAKRRQEQTGEQFPVIWVSIALIVGLPLLAAIFTGLPFVFEYPELRGFNFQGGLVVIPEFIALFLALSIYTSAFIAEIVRAGILAVSHGQTEAAAALGVKPTLTLRLVVIPQALRVIIPPLTSQYLNLTKNSSLAVAIGYPELVAVGGTILNQTGKAIEVISIWMIVYLSLSLFTSALMNWYNARMRLVER